MSESCAAICFLAFPAAIRRRISVFSGNQRFIGGMLGELIRDEQGHQPAGRRAIDAEALYVNAEFGGPMAD